MILYCVVASVIIWWVFDRLEMFFDPVVHRICHPRRRRYREHYRAIAASQRRVRIRELERELGIR